MNKTINKKNLAELKASLDILQEKYKVIQKTSTKKPKVEELKEGNSIKHLIIDYINRASSKKLSKGEMKM